MQDGQQHTTLNRFLLLLFIGSSASGCAALMYEVVWFHLLRLVIGTTTISLAILLTSFMGGMCLGSLWFHRLVDKRYHPLLIFALLETGIGLFGLLVPTILPGLIELYSHAGAYGGSDLLLRGLLCALVLLPPGVLMGASLPAVARWIQSSQYNLTHIGWFYAANLFGAVCGTVLSGFYLLRIYDVYIASGVAISLNASVALLAWYLSRRSAYTPVNAETTRHTAAPLYSIWIVYGVIALSGITSLGAQVVWTRLLSLLFGATVYTFAIILAVFLVGLGLGSATGSVVAKHTTRPLALLGGSQLLLMPAIFFAAYIIQTGLPDISVLNTRDSWLAFSIDNVLRCAVVLLPATFLWGMSFPLALASIENHHRDAGHWTGRVYAANTVGAIAGILLFSLVLIPTTGTQTSQQILIVLSAIASGMALYSFLNHHLAMVSSPVERQLRILSPLFVVGTLLVVLVANLGPIPPGMIAFGRNIELWDFPAKYLQIEEGINASVAVSIEEDSHNKNFHISGKVVASTWPDDMRLQRLLGHLPALLHEEPKSVLIIGFGAGISAGAFTQYDSIKRIVVVEIEPKVVASSQVHFARENYDIFNDPRTEIIYDDARHFMATTTETFDVISTDPIHPWVKGAASLYTREFLQLSKQKLNPGGILAQWVPLYQTSELAVKSEIRTFHTVFPQASVWSNDQGGSGYDLVVLASNAELAIDSQAINARIQQSPKILSSLAEVGFISPTGIENSFFANTRELEPWFAQAPLNLDRNLRLEYLAGTALNQTIEGYILRGMTLSNKDIAGRRDSRATNTKRP